MALIREATNRDREYIRDIYLDAFDEDEAKDIATLASNLLTEASSPKTYTIVAELDDAVVGHIAFSPVFLNSSKKLTGYILAPLGVKPAYQKQRVGSMLVENGMKLLIEKGINTLFVYGDPKFYGKFGFNAKTAAQYLPPYKLQYPFGWLALDLNKGDTIERTVKVSCVASLCNPNLW